MKVTLLKGRDWMCKGKADPLKLSENHIRHIVFPFTAC